MAKSFRKSPGIINRILNNPGLLITIVILLGFVFAPNEHADLAGVESGSSGLFGAGKTVRLLTMCIAGAMAFLVLGKYKSKGLAALFRGSIMVLLLYALLAEATVVFSMLPIFTIYKATELIVVVMLMAIVSLSSRSTEATIFYIKAVFWIYFLFVISALLEASIGGGGMSKQLVGSTPFLTTMLQSSYPPMVGNALGYLGALVAIFAVYLYDGNVIVGKKKKLVSAVIFFAGSSVLFLSYTRSILVFFIVCLFFLFAVNRQYFRLGALLCVLLLALLTPAVQEKIADHMRRGMSDEQISTMSGRTEFWSEIFNRSFMKIMVGQGFATASKLSGESSHLSTVGNAHNSLAEILMSSGIIGAIIWVIIFLRIGFYLWKRKSAVRRYGGREAFYFHNFMMTIFLLSILRTLMNSTFVYLDSFTFVMVSLILYTEVYCRSNLKSQLSHSQAVGKKPTRPQLA